MTGGMAAPQWPRVIDRYVLCDPIAQGGMATVHLGRLLGSGGFSRVVAIKRLHDFLAIDPAFRDMFLEEARLASRIRHPNVVASVDVVALEREAFLIMEYVAGEPLSFFCRAAAAKGRGLPTDIAVHVVIETLRGLGAAHDARNEKGEPLGIVHRDVSPQNVMVGADGITRVMDFGVAKAVGRAQNTREGQIKGKISYMAPEQVTGRGVTASSDVFSVAVVLWEALTGKRLFASDNDVEAMYNILEREIPAPSTITPDVPRALDEVVLRGLARAPANRYPTAQAMASALEALVHDGAVRAVASQAVARWVTDNAATPLAERAKAVQRIEQEDFTSALPPPSASRVVALPPPGPSSTRIHFVRPAPADVATLPEAPIPRPPRSALSRVLVAGAAFAAVVVVGIVVTTRGGSSAAQPPGAAPLAPLPVASAPPSPSTEAPPATAPLPVASVADVPTLDVSALPSASAALPTGARPPAVAPAGAPGVKPRPAGKPAEERLFQRD